MSNPAHRDESVEEAWARRIDSASLKLAPDITPTTLAEEFGGLSEDTAQDLCNEAATTAISTGATVVELTHFIDARDVVDESDDSADGAVTDDANRQMSSMRAICEGEDSDIQQPEENGGDSGANQEISDENLYEPDPAGIDRGDLETEVADLRETVSELQSTVDETQAIVEAVRRQLKQHSRLLVGDDSVSHIVDPDNVENHHQRLADLDKRVQAHGDQIQMVRVDGGGSRDDPDSRARLIRQTLYNKCDDNGKAVMDRDAVDSRLGGGLHRDTVLDAMKRAADGYQAEDTGGGYRPINGSSDLQPVDCVHFEAGDGRGSQSAVVMDLSDATGAEIRHNLTTDSTGVAQ